MQLRIVVRVHVDYAGSDNLSLGIDDFLGIIAEIRCDFRDNPVANPKIAREPRRTGPVHNRAAADDAIKPSHL